MDENDYQAEIDKLRSRIAELEQVNHKSAAEDLVKQADLFESIFNGIAVGIYVIDVSEDETFRFAAVNRTQESIIGLKAADIVGNSPWDLEYHFGKPVVERMVGLFRRCARENRALETLLQIDFPTPNEWWVSHLTPLADDKGHVYRLMATSTRVTERKRMEDALRESESLLRTILEHSEVAIVLATSDGVPQVVNRAFENLLGYSAEEVKMKSFAAITHPDDFEREKVLFQEVVEGRRDRYTIEKKSTHKNGSTVWTRVSGRPVLGADGEISHLVIVGEDISKRKIAEKEKAELEAAYRQSQKMEAVGQLAGGIAHDFNNLLSVVTGYADIAIKSVDDHDPLKKNLKQILNASEKATRLTSQLLSFGRRQMISPRAIDLNHVVSELKKILGRIIGADIQLRTKLSEDLGYIDADPNQIEQALMNLGINARDAMSEGGTLSIETHNEINGKIATDDASVYEGPCVVLTLSDTGKGMSKEVLERIFEPFYTTKEKGKGTGLGLAMVYGIVKQSRGNIEAASAPGRGSTFRLVFPQTQKPVDAPRSSVSEIMPHQGTETILVVEDDANVQELVVSMLWSAGYNVIAASNAGEAILECEKRLSEIDLMLTDILMPKMTGVELATRVSDLCPQMKILFMSGYSDPMPAQNGRRDDDDAFISKPFTTAALLKKVRQMLDSHPTK